MELQVGEWVKTESGEVGKVIHASRLTVVVALPDPPNPDRVEAMTDESLQSGDWVRADSGAVGQIIFASLCQRPTGCIQPRSHVSGERTNEAGTRAAFTLQHDHLIIRYHA